jgi:hypothetical protein
MATDLIGQTLAAQLLQRRQRQNPRSALAARLMAGSPPAGPITNAGAGLAYALTQGLDAFTGARMLRDEEEADARQTREGIVQLREHETAQRDAANSELDAMLRRFGIGGAPAAPRAPASVPVPDAQPTVPAAAPAPAGSDVRRLNADAGAARAAIMNDPNLTPEQQAVELARISAGRAAAGGVPERPGGYAANPGSPEAGRPFSGLPAPSGVVPPILPGASPGAGPDWRGFALAAAGSDRPNIQRMGQIAGQMANRDDRQPQIFSTDQGVFFRHPDGRVERVGGLPREAGEGAGPFRGSGIDAQSMNILLAPNADPASPVYATAYQQLYGPRLQTQPDGSTIIVQPQPPAGIRQPRGFGQTPAADAEAATTRPTVRQETAAGTVTRVPGAGTPLSSQDRTALGEMARTAGEWGALLESFHPEYSGYGSDILGNAANTVARNTPGASPRADWWQRYNLLANIERNALFGSALTARELEAWRAAMIGPGMNPDQVRLNMSRQAELARTALMRTAATIRANGGNVEAIAAATGLPLEAIMGNAAGAPPSAGTRTVNTREEAQALPEGTVYRTPDGRVFVR